MKHHHNITNHHQTHTDHLNERKSILPIILIFLLLFALIAGYIYLQTNPNLFTSTQATTATQPTQEQPTTLCQDNDPTACLILGDNHRNGKDETINNEKAYTDYQRACDLNHTPSCDQLNQHPNNE